MLDEHNKKKILDEIDEHLSRMQSHRFKKMLDDSKGPISEKGLMNPPPGDPGKPYHPNMNKSDEEDQRRDPLPGEKDGLSEPPLGESVMKKPVGYELNRPISHETAEQHNSTVNQHISGVGQPGMKVRELHVESGTDDDAGGSHEHDAYHDMSDEEIEELARSWHP